jgi:hypothetical protein
MYSYWPILHVVRIEDTAWVGARVSLRLRHIDESGASSLDVLRASLLMIF